MLESLTTLAPQELRHINRYVYCEKCRQMSDAVVLGRHSTGATLFRCQTEDCGSTVAIFVIRG